jgi:hypothetical protein
MAVVDVHVAVVPSPSISPTFFIGLAARSCPVLGLHGSIWRPIIRPGWGSGGPSRTPGPPDTLRQISHFNIPILLA